MRQLTSLDAQFLALETPRQSGHVGGLAILDPSTAPGGKLDARATSSELLAERLPLLPPLRWRLAEVPFGLDYPYWVDDPDFDLDFHVRELALPPPGDDEQLAEQVARIVARPLDRARPLWELYLIHGLERRPRRGAHQDPPRGRSTACRAPRSWACCSTSTPEGRELPSRRGPGRRPRAERARDARPRAARAAALPAAGRCARCPARCRTSTRRAFGGDPGRRDGRPRRPSACGARSAAARGAASSSARACARRRRSFNGRVSPHRRFAFGQLSLDEVKEVKNHYGCTVNDVVVAICAGAVRRWLIEPRRAAGRPARRADPGVGAHRAQQRHLRQPHPADERADLHQRAPTRSSACDDARGAGRR